MNISIFNSRNIVIAFVLVLIIFSPVSASADGGSALIQDYIQQGMEKANSWSFFAKVALILTLCVGVFGVISTTIQAANHQSVKKITALLGIAVGVFTVILNTLFEGDHRSFESMSNNAFSVVNQLKDLDVEYKLANKEEQTQLRSRATKLINTLIQRTPVQAQTSRSINDDPFIATPNHTFALQLVIPSAYAQESEKAPPEWVTSPDWTMTLPQQDGTYNYFVGQGASSVLSSAKKEATDDAIKHIKEFYSKEVKLHPALEGHVQWNGPSTDIEKLQFQNTYLQQSREDSSIQYFGLVPISTIQVANMIEQEKNDVMGFDVQARCIQLDLNSLSHQLPEEIAVTVETFVNGRASAQSTTMTFELAHSVVTVPLDFGESSIDEESQLAYRFKIVADGYADLEASSNLYGDIAGNRFSAKFKKGSYRFYDNWFRTYIHNKSALPESNCVLVSAFK